MFIWYIAYHLLHGLEKGVETTPAVIASKATNVLLDAYIVRDETVIYSSSKGGVNYLFDDGEKVGSGVVVANIYSGADAVDVSNRIHAIDKQIEVLENGGVSDNISVADSDSLDSKISELYYIIRDKLADGDAEYAIYKKDEFLAYLNKRLAMTQNSVNYSEQILNLKNERDALSQKLVDLDEAVTVKSSGYFYTNVDGYENIFDISKLKDLSLETYKQMVESEPSDYSGTNSIGKMVNSSEWYILAEATQEQLKKFNVGYEYEVSFPYNSDVSIKFKLEKTVREGESDRIILVFKTNAMPDGFNYLRKQNIQIAQESYTGYKVPSNAVRVVDGKKGVFTLNGNTVSFKEIAVLVEQDGYFIVEEQPSYLEDEFYYKKLGLYDMVITSGKDLYDGKIISSSGGKS